MLPSRKSSSPHKCPASVGAARDFTRLGDNLTEGRPSKLLIYKTRKFSCCHDEPGGQGFDNLAADQVIARFGRPERYARGEARGAEAAAGLGSFWVNADRMAAVAATICSLR